MPQPTSSRRRVGAALLLIATLAAPQLFASTASGDGLGDKKVEAKQIADRLDILRQQVEVLAEAYDNAQIRLTETGRRVVAAEDAVKRTSREVAKRQRDLADYAVSAYTGRSDSGALDLVLKGNTADIGVRDGYASAPIGDKADLVDSLRAAKADGDSTLAELRRVRKQAADARADVDKQRRAASSAVREAQQIEERVRGQLKALVDAEEARLAAAQRGVPATPPAATSSATPPGHQVAQGPIPSAAPRMAAPAQQTAAPAPSPPALAAVPVGQGAGAAIAAARSVLGVRYTWSGASPATGFDCSGLVMWAWAQGGKSLPHSSSAQYAMARKIPMSALQPGDLVFYGSPVQHVALYIGGGQIIHAPHTGSFVQVASIDYWKDLAGAGRV